jgi:hypothetical protein
MSGGPRNAGLWMDLGALRRYWWFPVAAIGIALAVALAFGAFSSEKQRARFGASAVVDALPPLFGPPVLPGPFDYASLAVSDDVVGDVASEHGLEADALQPRVRVEARPNSTDLDFTVTGDDALSIARTWERVFAEAVERESPGIERALTETYRVQLEQARVTLEAAGVAAVAAPNDVVAAQELAAAQENYETASRLVQSYDIVAGTLEARSFTVSEPHTVGVGLGTAGARAAAAVGFGLLAGVLGALGLEYAARRRNEPFGGYEGLPQPEPEPIARVRDRTGTSSR